MTYSIKCLQDLELAARVRAALLEHFPNVRVQANSGTLVVETAALKAGKTKASGSHQGHGGKNPGVEYVEVHVLNDIFRQAAESFDRNTSRVTICGINKEGNMSDQLEVLLLDDEPIVGKRLKPALAKIGCNVEVFEEPAVALKRLDEKNFDVVVTDIRMDDIDGIQVLEHVREKSQRTKVIMITGYAMMALAREAMEKGAFDFIAKPFQPDDLRRVIAKAAKELGSSINFEVESGI